MVEPKKPADRRPKATVESEHPAGWDLLRPFDDVPVWDQAELMEIIKPLSATAEAEGTDEERAISFDTRVVGELATMLQDRFVAPGREDDYARFVRGSGALQRVILLAVAYAEQLGESELSTSG